MVWLRKGCHPEALRSAGKGSASTLSPLPFRALRSSVIHSSRTKNTFLFEGKHAKEISFPGNPRTRKLCNIRAVTKRKLGRNMGRIARWLGGKRWPAGPGQFHLSQHR